MTKPLRTAFSHCEISDDVLKRDPSHERQGANSFANDLGLGRGVVLSRAVFSLRSIETKPCDCWIVSRRPGRQKKSSALCADCLAIRLLCTLEDAPRVH